MLAVCSARHERVPAQHPLERGDRPAAHRRNVRQQRLVARLPVIHAPAVRAGNEAAVAADADVRDVLARSHPQLALVLRAFAVRPPVRDLGRRRTRLAANFWPSCSTYVTCRDGCPFGVHSNDAAVDHVHRDVAHRLVR